MPESERNRFLTTFLYKLPFGKGKRFLNGSNAVMSRLIGGFVLSGVALLQSGPFLTVATYNDPSGTGFASLFANGERADMVKGVDLAKGRYAPDDYHHFIGVEISNSAMRIAGISSSAEVRYKNLSES